MQRSEAQGSWVTRGILLLGFVASVVGFDQLSFSYEDFLLPQSGVTFVPERELAFYAYYSLCGLLGLACATSLLASFGEPRVLTRARVALVQRPRLVVAVIALGVFVASALFRGQVLDRQPIADDEASYLFIARTLLEGRLINPVPEDPELFRNQFIVIDDRGWYGKYPIGHPLLLALGELLALRDLIVPIVAALCVPLSFAVGRHWFGAGRAQLGAALVLLSPHFVGTAGTLLSQPTSCLMLLLSVWLMLRAELSKSALAALALGFGVLVRPLPGGLFALVAIGWAVGAAARTERTQRGPAIARVALLTSGAALGACAVLFVNYVQTGDALRSGYHQAHGSVSVFNNQHADLASSLAGALLRENVWLLGVPGCLLPVLFARPQRSAALYWGMLGAELAYRLISPKTVVASTGPIYLTEVVPLLLLGVVDGLCRLRERLRFDGAALRVSALPLTAATLAVACAMFWPVQYRTLRRGVEARALVPHALERAGATRALVFADTLVSTASVHTWAYFPDNPSPDLRDDILYLRLPKRGARELWQRRFPDRRAFVLSWNARAEPAIEEL